jgi:Zincin-like metallopeptidase
MQDGSSLSIRLTGPAGPAQGASGEQASGTGGSGFFRRRRNRHGRGLRGELIPVTLPGSRTRTERFDDWVMESADRLQQFWGERIDALQFMVQEIPEDLEKLVATRGPIPMGSCTPAAEGRPGTITVYRHPIEMAARGYVPANELVHDVIVEQAAELLGMSPEAVDPGYGRSQL